MQTVLYFAVRVLLGVTGTLILHFGGANMLSLVGRQSNPNGSFKHSITKNRYHLIGVGLAVLAGIILALPLPKTAALTQVVAAGLLMLTDEFLIYKAIRAVEGDGWLSNQHSPSE